MDINELKRRFQRCAAAQAGVLSKEDATLVCREAVLGSRGVQTRSTRRRTSSGARRRTTSQKKRNRS
jgi:hypothetical protein